MAQDGSGEESDKSVNKTSSDKITRKTQLGINLGSVKLVPYGTIYFNLYGNSAGTNMIDDPLFATSADHGSLGATVRQTRFGAKLEGPELLDAKSSGVIETDFFGGFPGIGIGEHFNLVRLRLAYAKLDWDKYAVTGGQDWTVFAPLNPTSIAAAAIPQAATAGNLWARLPQIKLDTKIIDERFLLQAAILSPATGDWPPNANYVFLAQNPGIGPSSKVPAFETRFGFKDDVSYSKQKISAGISLHYGRSRGTRTNYILGISRTKTHGFDSFGLAGDWNLPLPLGLKLTGEAYFGRNLGAFQGGAFQSYNSNYATYRGSTLIETESRGIGTRGGWAQLGWSPKSFNFINVNFTYSQDDPRDQDLVSATPTDWRLRNQMFAVNLINNITEQLSWGLEFRRLNTENLLSGKHSNNHLNLTAAFTF